MMITAKWRELMWAIIHCWRGRVLQTEQWCIFCWCFISKKRKKKAIIQVFQRFGGIEKAKHSSIMIVQKVLISCMIENICGYVIAYTCIPPPHTHTPSLVSVSSVAYHYNNHQTLFSCLFLVFEWLLNNSIGYFFLHYYTLLHTLFTKTWCIAFRWYSS